MLLVGGIWTTPTPFTVVRQRLWRRRVRRVSSDREDGNGEEEKTKLQVAHQHQLKQQHTTTSSPELLLLLNQISDSQDTLQTNLLEKMTKDEDMKREKDTMDAKIKALKEQHDAQLQSTKDLFEKRIQQISSELEDTSKALKLSRENHEKRIKEEQQRHENVEREFLDRELHLNNQMKLLQQSVALEKSEAHRSIERSKKEIEKIRSDMEHELAKSHDELIAAVKQREDTVRFDCNQDKLNLEKQHNETIAMLNIRASKAVEAAVREGSEEVARANRRTAKEVASARQDLLVEIDRVRKDAHALIARSIQDALKECLRERTLRVQAEEALEIARRTSADSLVCVVVRESFLNIILYQTRKHRYKQREARANFESTKRNWNCFVRNSTVWTNDSKNLFGNARRLSENARKRCS